MSSWQLLNPEDENQLHKSRLFSVEEKPFKRVAKRLGTISSLCNAKVRQTITPPPEEGGAATGETISKNSTTAAEALDNNIGAGSFDVAQFTEDITLDFAAFDYAIGRLQFLHSANVSQRERYAAERGNILETCNTVRETTTQLRVRLAEAQATQRQREGWDALVRKINENKLLVERPKQEAQLTKLEDECAALEAETETYGVTWRERKEQFARIMDESMRLRRLIRDEKEEVERREGMDEDEADKASEAGSHTPRPSSASGNATPGQEGSGTASAIPGRLAVDAGDATPMHSSLGGASPMPQSPEPSTMGGLKPKPDVARGGRTLRGSRAPSRASSRPSTRASSQASQERAASQSPSRSGSPVNERGSENKTIDAKAVDAGTGDQQDANMEDA